MTIFRTIRLWYWWVFVLNKDEFCFRLNMNKIDCPYNLVAKRQLAHELDLNDSWKNIFKLANKTNLYNNAFNKRGTE